MLLKGFAAGRVCRLKTGSLIGFKNVSRLVCNNLKFFSNIFLQDCTVNSTKINELKKVKIN